MKVPQSVKVGWNKYKIELVEEFEQLLENNLQVCGECLHAEGMINLLEFQGKEFLKRTLLHEILHCILEVYGIDLRNKNEEATIDGLATALMELIKNNPKLIKYLGDK